MMKLPGAWTPAAKWSACGASVSSPNACLAWRNSPDRVGPDLFPPEVVVQIKALACELPSQQQVPLARWSVPEIARHAVQSGLVASINRVVAAGVPVAAFNSESSSLRGLMDQLSHRAQKLITVSDAIAGSAESSGQATSQIAANISQMAESATSEAAAMTRANASIERIAASVEAIAGGARDQALAADSLSQAAAHIARAVEVAVSSSDAVAGATVQADEADGAAHLELHPAIDHGENEKREQHGRERGQQRERIADLARLTRLHRLLQQAHHRRIAGRDMRAVQIQPPALQAALHRPQLPERRVLRGAVQTGPAQEPKGRPGPQAARRHLHPV